MQNTAFVSLAHRAVLTAKGVQAGTLSGITLALRYSLSPLSLLIQLWSIEESLEVFCQGLDETMVTRSAGQKVTLLPCFLEAFRAT
jgi:hypothetical protein